MSTDFRGENCDLPHRVQIGELFKPFRLSGLSAEVDYGIFKFPIIIGDLCA
jgi:hypothetical protein